MPFVAMIFKTEFCGVDTLLFYMCACLNVCVRTCVREYQYQTPFKALLNFFLSLCNACRCDVILLQFNEFLKHIYLPAPSVH